MVTILLRTMNPVVNFLRLLLTSKGGGMSDKRLIFGVFGAAAATGGIAGFFMSLSPTPERQSTLASAPQSQAPPSPATASPESPNVESQLSHPRSAADELSERVAQYAAANGGRISLRAYGALARAQAAADGYSDGYSDSSDDRRYTAASGTQYKYDLSNPSDLMRYRADAAAQMRDSINPRVRMDRNMGQYGGGSSQ